MDWLQKKCDGKNIENFSLGKVAHAYCQKCGTTFRADKNGDLKPLSGKNLSKKERDAMAAEVREEIIKELTAQIREQVTAELKAEAEAAEAEAMAKADEDIDDAEADAADDEVVEPEE